MPQNNIVKSSITSLGYGFIAKQFLPKGKDEYYLRNMQNKSGINYRHLTAYEIEVLVRNRNTSDNWNKILVSDAFNPELVQNCKFYGLVKIGKLEACCLEFSDLKVPVGLYNSTIISCDFGENVCIDNVRYLSHYIIGNEVIINNVNELATTSRAKFGNGIIKEGEPESIRIWMELCNENGGRSVLPFNGMLPADAYLWSQYRDDVTLQEKFKQFTEARFNNKQGYYGKIGHRTVIKNTAIIKDVWIGNDAYIKGANKLKNLTINSGEEGKSQIGEGCELVNGIIDYGCRIFYGAKAVRFVMASHSQLKYGARLINSYLGNNATISCCEVLNSLIFPAHEQHHNNSFLCASLIMGQSNIAAGATIGSNHNSRAADGEIVAGRGFWPGLCVSLKHNSRFASFTMIAKSDYLYELDIQLPFSLVSNDVHKDQLNIMPAYWFMYNMYALERNSRKYIDRDKRNEKHLALEYNYLAPDTINEITSALVILEEAVGKAYYTSKQQLATSNEYQQQGKQLLLAKDTIIQKLVVELSKAENSKRKVVILKTQEAYDTYRNLITYYLAQAIVEESAKPSNANITDLLTKLPKKIKQENWVNVGGQLMSETAIQTLTQKIKNNTIKSWDGVHTFYKQQAADYAKQKLQHAIASFCMVNQVKRLSIEHIQEILRHSVVLKEQFTAGIYQSREKDYTNYFRTMMYTTTDEMNKVVGALADNTFINQQQQELLQYKKTVKLLLKK